MFGDYNMECTQLTFRVSQGLRSGWRTIGVLENLTSDTDIAQLLVNLYLHHHHQTEGVGCHVRCGQCQHPLTLHCDTCQWPAQLTTTNTQHHHHPPSSLPSSTSPQPPLPPPSVSDSTGAPPSSINPSVQHSSESASVEVHALPSLHTEKAVFDVEDEEKSSQIEGEFDFDDCPVDFGGARQDSDIGDGNDESNTLAKSKLAKNLTPPPIISVRKRSTRNGKVGVILDSESAKKRRTFGTKRSTKRKRLKNNWCMIEKRATDLKVENNNLKDDDCRKSDVLNCRTSSSKHARLSAHEKDSIHENLNKRKGKREICETQNIEDGFLIPTEQRRLAVIHTFDDSLVKFHKMENSPGSKSKPCTKGKRVMRQGEAKQNIESVETSSKGQDSAPNQNKSNSDYSGEGGLGNDSMKILVSAQKIPPLKTADGSYARSLYTHFECLYCQKAFLQKRVFNKHIHSHIEENPHKCPLCNKSFESSNSLKEHEKKHKLECEFCGKKCTKQNDYSEHMRLHTENNGVMKCPGCSYQSTDFFLYRKHKYACAYLRPALQCEICGQHLKSAKSLKHHIAAIHKNDRPYKCALCEKSFVFKTKLTCHTKYNHAEGGRLFHCDKCGYRFIDPKGLKSHLKSVHSDEKPFKCTYCTSAFARRYTLGVHMRLHTGEKPFRCTECLQAFVQKPSLVLHLKTHHGQDLKVKKTAEAKGCS